MNIWVNENGQIDVYSDHNMLVMTYEYGTEETTTTKTRSMCTHWKVRGVDWEDYKKDLENTELNMVGGEDDQMTC